MKLYICYPAGHAPVSNPCRIFGFDGSEPTDDWEIHAAYDFNAPVDFSNAIIKFLTNYDCPYDDTTFSKPIEEFSADCLMSFVNAILNDTPYRRLRYTVLERIWRTDEWIEWQRQVSSFTGPLLKR